MPHCRRIARHNGVSPTIVKISFMRRHTASLREKVRPGLNVAGNVSSEEIPGGHRPERNINGIPGAGPMVARRADTTKRRSTRAPR